MKNSLEITKDFLLAHKYESIVTAVITLIFIFLIALFIYDTTPHYTYQPTKACELLTPARAQKLLGEKVISVNTPKDPVADGDTATSKCSYTDENPDQSKMIVAALAIRSGTNDAGVQQNNAEFNANVQTKNIETVKGIGEKAYFNKDLGQLNIIKGHDWYIVSYGVGATPESNSIDKEADLAKMILP